MVYEREVILPVVLAASGVLSRGTSVPDSVLSIVPEVATLYSGGAVIWTLDHVVYPPSEGTEIEGKVRRLHNAIVQILKLYYYLNTTQQKMGSCSSAWLPLLHVSICYALGSSCIE